MGKSLGQLRGRPLLSAWACLFACFVGCSGGPTSSEAIRCPRSSRSSPQGEYVWGERAQVIGRVPVGELNKELNLKVLRGGGDEAIGSVSGQETGQPNLALPMLRNVLDFSTRLTNTSAPARNLTLDPERLAFLNEALKSMIGMRA